MVGNICPRFVVVFFIFASSGMLSLAFSKSSLEALSLLLFLLLLMLVVYVYLNSNFRLYELNLERRCLIILLDDKMDLLNCQP